MPKAAPESDFPVAAAQVGTEPGAIVRIPFLGEQTNSEKHHPAAMIGGT